MKRTIFNVLVTGLIAASVFGFVSCGDSYDYDADTVYSLDAPRVTAKAYPGVNYIFWEPVTSATGYKIYRVQDGVSTGLGNLASDVTCYADIAAADGVLEDGKEYKYIVEAISASDPATRAVYAKNSKGDASARAVVPTAGSLAISAEPTSDSGKDYIKKYYEKLVTKLSENVKLSVADGYYYVEYPATAGFKYGITIAPKGQHKAAGDSIVDAASNTNINYKEDYKAEFKEAVTDSSEVEILLRVASVSELYRDVVVPLGSLTPKNIGESEQSSGLWCGYIDSKTVLVSWTPAKLASTNDYSPVKNFKVYRSSTLDSTWTAVSAEVKEIDDYVTDNNGVTGKKYYIKDTLEDNTIMYYYYVVHTDGTYFGSNYLKHDLIIYGGNTFVPTLTVSTIVGNTSGLKNTIKIISSKNKYSETSQTLALSYVKLEKAKYMNYSMGIPLSDFTPLELTNENGYDGSYINYIENAEEGTYLVKLTASEEGYADTSVYKLVTVNSASVSTSTLTVTYNTSNVTVKESIAKDSKLDSVSNYTYTLYKVETTTNGDLVTVSTTKVSDVELGYDTTDSAYTKTVDVAKSTETGVKTSYYVVKALASDSSVFAKVVATGN